MVLCGAAPPYATWASLVACSVRFVWFWQDFDEFLTLWAPFFRLTVEGLSVLGSGRNCVYGKHGLSTFQWNWHCVILTSVQKTATSGRRAVGLISAFRMVFPSFPARIPVSLDMFLTNRKKLIVEEVALLEKALAFWKLMIRIGTILCAKVVCRLANVGNFPTLWLVFIIFPTLNWPSSRC